MRAAPSPRLVLITGLVALASVLVACGDDADGSADAGTAETEAADAGSGTGTTGELAGVVREPPLQVGDVSLPDVTPGQGGEPFTFRAPDNGLLLVYFGFTYCPDVCPTTLADIRTALEGLGPDADRITVAMATVDPERDTPDVLHDYVEFFAGDRARALRTEDLDRLREVEEAFLASSELIPVEGSGDEYEVEHTAVVYVVDDGGTVLVEWPFGTEPEAMQADLERLLAEA